MTRRLAGRLIRRWALGGEVCQVDKEGGNWWQGAIQPPAKVPLQRRKDKDQNHLLLNLDLSLEFMRNVSSTFILQRHR